VPAVDGNLAGDDDGALVVPLLDDFEQVAGLIGIEHLQAPVVEDEQFDAGERAQEAGVAARAVGDGEIGEEPGSAGVENGDVLSASLLAEGAGEPTFAETGGPGNQNIAAFLDPAAGSELEEQGAVEAAGVLLIDVLDVRAVAQFGGAGAGLELLLPAQGRFVFEQ